MGGRLRYGVSIHGRAAVRVHGTPSMSGVGIDGGACMSGMRLSGVGRVLWRRVRVRRPSRRVRVRVRPMSRVREGRVIRVRRRLRHDVRRMPRGLREDMGRGLRHDVSGDCSSRMSERIRVGMGIRPSSRVDGMSRTSANDETIAKIRTRSIRRTVTFSPTARNSPIKRTPKCDCPRGYFRNICGPGIAALVQMGDHVSGHGKPRSSHE